MKKILLICLLTGVINQINAFSSPPEEKQLRDSIFQVAQTIKDDTLRITFMRNMFQRYIGKEWPTELLDSALILTRKANAHKEEIAVLFDYYHHYQFQGDVPNAERYLSALKEPSYRYKIYDSYYIAWSSVLEFKCAQGDTEHAIMEAKQMQIEAIRLNYPKGIPIAKLTLARALKFAQRKDEAITIYREILQHKDITENMKITVYGDLSDTYYAQKKYKQAILELQQQRSIIDILITENPENLYRYRNRLLEIELSFCSIYIAIPEEENLKLHLEESKKYYSKNCFVGYFIKYHSCWGYYYSLIKEWDTCFREFDIALSSFKKIQQPRFENSVLKMKADAVMAAGRLKEAAELYRLVALKGDSLNHEILRLHEGVHKANYEIQQALYDKEKSRKQYHQIAVGASSLILMVLIFVIVRTVHIQRSLRRSEKQTRKALELMKATDRMKELFLKNITYEIRIPLNAVVGFSDLLSTEKGLTPDEMGEYSTIIKTNAGKLLLIINNVLDLSRLEAGMMRFNPQKCDAVQLCRDAKMMVEMQEHNPVQLTFTTELELLPIEADSKWFIRVLFSALSAPKGDEEPCSAEYILTQKDTNLRIIIQESPLCHLTNNEQDQRIQHEINRLYLESFNGTYQLLEKEKGKRVIVITYPL